MVSSQIELLMRELNIAHGRGVDSHTTTPNWLGERLDVGWAIDVLHPLAVGSTEKSPLL